MILLIGLTIIQSHLHLFMNASPYQKKKKKDNMQFFCSNTIMTLKQCHNHHQRYLQTDRSQQRLPPCKNGINGTGSPKCTHAYYVTWIMIFIEVLVFGQAKRHIGIPATKHRSLSEKAPAVLVYDKIKQVTWRFTPSHKKFPVYLTLHLKTKFFSTPLSLAGNLGCVT